MQQRMEKICVRGVFYLNNSSYLSILPHTTFLPKGLYTTTTITMNRMDKKQKGGKMKQHKPNCPIGEEFCLDCGLSYENEIHN